MKIILILVMIISNLIKTLISKVGNLKIVNWIKKIIRFIKTLNLQLMMTYWILIILIIYIIIILMESPKAKHNFYLENILLKMMLFQHINKTNLKHKSQITNLTKKSIDANDSLINGSISKSNYNKIFFNYIQIIFN